MLGNPKYSRNDIVTFEFNGETKIGTIAIIDTHGTIEQNTEVSYDIFVEDENCLYKHIVESLVNKID